MIGRRESEARDSEMLTPRDLVGEVVERVDVDGLPNKRKIR